MGWPTLLITRPALGGQRFAHQARQAGFSGRVLFSPVIRIVACQADPPPQATLVFTSENGVHAAGPLVGRRAFAVGRRTAQAACAAGADCSAAGEDVNDLLAHLVQHRDLAPFAHLHGRYTTGDLVSRLQAAGITATSHIVYDQQACPPSGSARHALEQTGDVLAPLFSPRSAKLLKNEIAQHGANLRPFAISAAVAEAWGASIPIAKTPSAPAMIETLLSMVPTALVGPSLER